MSEYNQSQYRLMLAGIEEYERGELGLNSLVVDLMDPFRNLYGEQQDWNARFMENWRVLEQIKGNVVFRGNRRLTPEEAVEAKKAVQVLKEMATERLVEELDPNSPAS